MNQPVALANKKALFAVFLIVFIDVLSFTIVLPFLPFYAEKFGASPSQVGLLITIFALCQFLSGPTLGRLSDIHGRRLLLAISQLGTFVGFLVLGFANSLWMIYLARVIDGVTAGNITVAQATIADLTPPQQRSRAFAIIGISFGLGFFIGPALSGLLSHFSISAPIWFAASLSLLSVFSTWFFLPESKPHALEVSQGQIADLGIQEKPKFNLMEQLHKVFDVRLILNYLKKPDTRKPLLQFFFFNMAFTASIAGFALYTERKFQFNGHPFGAKEVGYLYAYLGLIGIFIQGFLFGKVSDWLGDRKTAMLGFFLQAVGYIGYALISKISELLVFATAGSFGSGFVRPSVTSLLSKSASPREQGTILGVGQSLGSLAGIISPMVVGRMIETQSATSWCYFAAAAALLGLIFG